jgi:mitogen-activated protein kinase organizer 1
MQEPSSSTNLPRVPVARLAGHDGPVQAIVFTSDGKWCLTGGLDRTVKLWNPFRVDPQYTAAIAAKSSKSLRSTTRPPREMKTAISAFQDLPPALNIQTYSGGLTHDISALCVTTAPSLSSSSSQTLLAACNKTLVVTDLVSNQVKRRLGQHHHTGRINAVAATTQYGGEAYVTASYDATVAIWDGRSRDTKPLQVLKDAKDSVTSVYIRQQTSGGGAHNSSSSVKDYSNNIAIIRTASVDGIVRTYDLRKGLLQCDNFGSPVMSMAHTKDGNCLAVSCLDGTIRLMELETGELLNTYNSHHTAGQYGLDVDVLADDATIITGSENGACALYDLVRANMVQVLDGPARRPTCTVATHPKQSSVVVAASYDNSTVVWSHDDIPWQEQLHDNDDG